MPRIDDYREALRIAKENILKQDLSEIAEKAGGEFEENEEEKIIRFSFFTDPCLLRVKGGDVSIELGIEGKELSLTDQVLVAHYLLGASGEKETGEWITFRDIPDGHFYYDAFLRRARDPFLKTFGEKLQLYERVAPMIGGVPVEGIGDVAFDFRVFPRITLRIILWKGDDEFPPEASILFDKNIQLYLSVEDIAYLSGGVVYRMMGIARSFSQ
ncbi:MAG: DUF3786 domain-containing protein [Thermodesulforhabdaceae bacterium]